MIKPTFKIEKKCWQKSFDCVIGVDEVGRGALAGPVVAGAACLQRIRNLELGIRNILELGINDSKKLTAKRREELAIEICKYFEIGIGEASIAEINRLGIVGVTQRAMRRAIKNLEFRIKNYELTIKKKPYLLVDGFYLKYVRNIGIKNQMGIVNGDGKCITIAAASIMAKVYRDNLMSRLSGLYLRYKWDENKGYGTEYHRNMISKYGVTKLHRKAFVHSY